MRALTQKDTLVFFAADPGYAFPMLAAARSFRENGRCDEADVTMFAVDFSPGQLEAMRACAAPWRIAVSPLDSRTFVPVGASAVRSADADFQHLTTAALARLAAWRAIPETYVQALYIDGDTWCTGDFRPLVESRATPGMLHATPDPINFYKRDMGSAGAAARAYLGALGLSLAATYYSSGVLLGDLAAWRELGEAALSFFFANPAACRLFDQSALNGAANARLRPMSLRWNFTTQLRTWGLDPVIAPRIAHFAGPGKPWLGPVAPWQDFYPRYESIRAESGGLAPPHASPARLAALNAQAGRRSLKSVTLDRLRAARVRDAIAQAERAAPF